ncbi:hypothetical protein D3C81_1316960 [compost metagenome]
MANEIKRDLHDDLTLCREVADIYPNMFVMHGTDVMCENPPGSCDLDGVAWTHTPKAAEFIAEAYNGWPHAIERALASEIALLALVEALERGDIAQTRMSSGTDCAVYTARKAVGR